MPKIQVEITEEALSAIIPQNFNMLSPAETERLALLIEEAAEVQHIAAKILRHGYASVNPVRPNSGNNRMLLQDELGHLVHVVSRMKKAGDVSESAIVAQAHHKANSIVSYLHHQEDAVK